MAEWAVAVDGHRPYWIPMQDRQISRALARIASKSPRAAPTARSATPAVISTAYGPKPDSSHDLRLELGLDLAGAILGTALTSLLQASLQYSLGGHPTLKLAQR